MRLLGRDVGQPLVRRGQRAAGLFELPGDAALLLGGAVPVGPTRLTGRGVPVVGSLRAGAGIAAAAEHNAALGQVGPGQFGGCGGVLGPAARLFDRGSRHHAGRRAHAPAGRCEAVTFGGDHHEVVAGQREVDGLLPPVDPDGATDQGVEHRLGDRSPLPHPHMAPDRLGTAAGGQLPDPRRRRPWRQDGAGDPALAQGGQRGLRRAPAVDHDGGDAGTDGSLEGGVPALVDLDQVDQGTDDTVDVAQQLAPARALQVRQRPLQCLGPGGRAVACFLGLVGRELGRFRRLHGCFELRTARRQLGGQGRGRLLELVGLLGEEVGPHRGARRPLLEAADTRPERVHVLLLARRRPAYRLDARPDPGQGLIRRVLTQHRRPACPQCLRLMVESGERRLELGSLGCAAGLFLGLGRHQLAGQAGRLGLERRDHVDVGGGIERGHHAPAPLPQHAREPTGAFHQPLDSTQRVGQVLFAAGRQLCGGRGRLGVELLERGVQLLFLVATDGQVLCGRLATSAQVCLLGPGEIPPQRQQLGRHAVVRTGRRRLPLQRPDLAPHLADQVAQALQVLSGPRQPALRPLAPAPVLQHAGRLFDDGASVFGPGVEDRVELALADDHVLLTTDARVAQQLLDVEQAARRPVDGVLAVARAEERPGDGHLGQVDRELAQGVVDGQRHLGPAQLGPRGGPGEDDILHLRRAQRARPLGAQHPRDGVDDV